MSRCKNVLSLCFGELIWKVLISIFIDVFLTCTESTSRHVTYNIDQCSYEFYVISHSSYIIECLMS